MIIIMEQTADLFIAEDPQKALDLMYGSEQKETQSGLKYIILNETSNEQTPYFPTTA